MKSILLVIFVLLICVSCSKSQITEDEWASVALMFESGPVSPEWQYSYIININSDGNSRLTYTFDYRRDNNLVYNFLLTKEQLKILNDKLKTSKALEGKIPSLSENEQPIGGHLEKVRIVFVTTDPNSDRPPKMFETPYFPDKEYLSGLNDLYDYIRSLVPEESWKDAESKRLEVINKPRN